MKRLEAVVCVLIAGCGYTFGAARLPGGVRAIGVGEISEPGIDLDAAALISISVRRAIARGPRTELAPSGEGDARLELKLIDSSAGLAPFADSATRAAQYLALIKISGALIRSDGAVLWRSPLIQGEAPFISVPGAIESLDGARRRALAQAADDAATKLVAALVYSR